MGKKRSYPDGLCRHCGVKKINRPRALCWRCFHVEGVKDLYPPLPGSYAANSVPKAGQGRLPKEPTHHPPGSDGKMAVMAERAERGECLFHPDDARSAPGLGG